MNTTVIKKGKKGFIFHFSRLQTAIIVFCMIAIIGSVGYISHVISLTDTLTQSQQKSVALENSNVTLKNQLQQVEKDLVDFKSQDQVKINQENKTLIKNIETTYKQAVVVYEKLVDIKIISKNTKGMDEQFAKSLNQLSDKNYTSAAATLGVLTKAIDDEKAKIAAANAPAQGLPAGAQNAPVNNAPPAGGYSRQNVKSDKGTFLVDIISADLGSTRVIVDTASDGDCGNNCPVLPLATYAARSGAFAGINGSYFCPADYPSCAGKTNTFDLLVMNKNKVYMNSGNNVYSNNPAVIFGSGFVRFVGRASEWGRDTGVDGVLSNYPMLVSGGNVVYSDNPDPKFNSKGGRSFVANKGNTVYMGVVYNASLGDSAASLKALGIENALNLDNGGSTALWSGGYKSGPGRSLPNVILFVRR